MARKPRQKKESYKKKTSGLKKELKNKGLNRFPYNDFDESTKGEGILGIGLLKERPNIFSGFSDAILNERGNEVYLEPTIPNYTYFFVTRENPSVRGDEDSQYSFYVVQAKVPISIQDCAKQLGIPERNVNAISQEDIDSGTFPHPRYINFDYEELSIRYGEIALLPQQTEGRMDDVPFGYPAFNYNPSPIITQEGVRPAAPYTEFYVAGTTAGSTAGVNVATGATVQFLDNSVRTPAQVRPSSWEWNFGGMSATGSTAQNPIVTVSATGGSYSISLTATNETGSTTLTKINYIIVS